VRALDLLRVSPLLIRYVLCVYLSKFRDWRRRSISAVWPPEPRTMRSFAEDFRGDAGCGLKEGRIHRRRTRINVESVVVTTKARMSTECSDIKAFGLASCLNWNFELC
jgi:hypothetical protein